MILFKDLEVGDLFMWDNPKIGDIWHEKINERQANVLLGFLDQKVVKTIEVEPDTETTCITEVSNMTLQARVYRAMILIQNVSRELRDDPDRIKDLIGCLEMRVVKDAAQNACIELGHALSVAHKHHFDKQFPNGIGVPYKEPAGPPPDPVSDQERAEVLKAIDETP